MTIKKITVNLAWIVALALVIVWCVQTGQAHNLILDNNPVKVDGKDVPAFEAIYVHFGDDPDLMLEGDTIVKRVVGSNYTMTVNVVDDDDNVLESKTMSFTLDDVKDTMRLSVPEYYAKAK